MFKQQNFKEFKQLRMLLALSDTTLIILSSTLNLSNIFSKDSFKFSDSWRPLRYANPKQKLMKLVLSLIKCAVADM